MAKYTVEAVEADCILAKPEPRRKWCVAFYRDGRLYAVQSRRYTRAGAELSASMCQQFMDDAVRDYVDAVAERVKP